MRNHLNFSIEIFPSGSDDPSITMSNKPVICFFTVSSGNWGGASRVLYTNLWRLDTTRLTPLLILPGKGPIEPELKAHSLKYEVWSPFTEPGAPLVYLKGTSINGA